MNQSRPELCRFRPAKIIGSSFSRVESTEFVRFAAVKPRQLILTTAGALGMRTFGLLVASLVLARHWVSIILNDSFLLNNSSNDYFLSWFCWRLIYGGGGTAHPHGVISQRCHAYLGLRRLSQDNLVLQRVFRRLIRRLPCGSLEYYYEGVCTLTLRLIILFFLTT